MYQTLLSGVKMVIWRIDRSLSLGRIDPSEHHHVESDHSESTHLFMKYPEHLARLLNGHAKTTPLTIIHQERPFTRNDEAHGM